VSDPLTTFKLDDLAQFTREGVFSPSDSTDYRVLYVGRDDVHGALKYVLERCTRSLVFNMFGYDDDELDAEIKRLVEDDGVFVQGTLDKSQAGGVHEKKILAAWSPKMRASFAVGESASHQISHTKGGVLDGVLAFEGSTNWSASGEGSKAGGNTKAQNNTLTFHVHPIQVARFVEELNEEHVVALHQEAAKPEVPSPKEYVVPAVGFTKEPK
jgi:hypothetical protein